MSMTAFERRRRRVPVHKRDQVQWVTGEQSPGGIVYRELREWLRAKDAELANEIRTRDPRSEGFLEWYEGEHHKYGRRVSDGIALLYWATYFANPKEPALDRDRFDRLRDALAVRWRGEWLDGEWQSSRSLVQEYLWMHQHDWVLQTHLVDAIREFHEFERAGKMGDWRRRKRRRTAAARRKSIKALYEQALFTAVPPADAVLVPTTPAKRDRRRSHQSGLDDQAG